MFADCRWCGAELTAEEIEHPTPTGERICEECYWDVYGWVCPLCGEEYDCHAEDTQSDVYLVSEEWYGDEPGYYRLGGGLGRIGALSMRLRLRGAWKIAALRGDEAEHHNCEMICAACVERRGLSKTGDKLNRWIITTTHM